MTLLEAALYVIATFLGVVIVGLAGIGAVVVHLLRKSLTDVKDLEKFYKRDK